MMGITIKSRKTFFIVTILVISLLSLFGVTSLNRNGLVKKEEPVKKLRLGYIKTMAELPLYVAIENKYFQNEGIEVELVPLGYKEEMDALIRGDIDIIPATSLTLPFGIETQSEGKIKIFNLGGINDNDNEVVEGVLIPEDSSIKELKDLVGKKIGVTQGGIDYFVMKTVLTKLGLDPEKNKIEIKQMSGDVLPQVFISHNVDAIYLAQPQLASVKNQTSAKYLIVNPRAKYVANPFWSGGGVVLSDYLQKEDKKALFVKYLKAIDLAINYMRNNSLESKKMLSKYAKIDEGITGNIGNYFKVKTGEKVDFDSLQKIANIYKEVGILNKFIKVVDMVFQ